MRPACGRICNYNNHVEVIAVNRKKTTAWEAYLAGKLRLPPGYHVELDADLLALLREDGSKVTAFVAGVTPSEVAKAAEEDYRASGNNSA
jgi:hypothetical protein